MKKKKKELHDTREWPRFQCDIYTRSWQKAGEGRDFLLSLFFLSFPLDRISSLCFAFLLPVRGTNLSKGIRYESNGEWSRSVKWINATHHCL